MATMASVVAAVAGPTAAQSPAPTLTVGSMVWETGNPFYVNFIKGQQDAAAEFGIELDVQNGNSNLATQVSVVQQFISQGKDLIVVTPGDAEGIVPVVNEATAAGIPVIAANNNVGAGADIVTFVGSSNYHFGELQCQLLIDAIGTEGNVGYILGALGTDPQVNRKAGMLDCLAQYPDIHIVAEQTANWDFSQALTVVQDWLNKYPQGELDAIVDQGPEAVNAAQYAADTGRGEVKFILGNYPATAQTAINDGVVFGTVVEDPYSQGYTSIEYAYYWLTDQQDKVEQPEHFMENPVVTKENAADIPPEM
jgi:ABC-type sugar transport system substrate-binding protein